MIKNHLKFYLNFLLVCVSSVGSYAETITTQEFTFEAVDGDPRGGIQLIDNEEIVYNNDRGEKGDLYFSNLEVGDQIGIKISDRKSTVINKIQFEYFAALNPFNSSQRCIFRVYLNDNSPTVENGPNQPGTVLFESNPFKLIGGYQMVSFTGLDFTVPAGSQSITWSAEFAGLSTIEKVGLLLNEKPSTGSNEAHLWNKLVKGGKSTWQTVGDSQDKYNFSARIIGNEKDPEIAIENNIIKYGSTFDVVFSNGPKKKSDWIGIYKKDVIPGSSAPIAWKYLNDSNQILSNGRISFLADFAPGEYQVLFFINDTFEILDDTDLIVLESPPVINAINKDQEIVILGDSITLSVDASGVEPVYYQWLKDDVPIASEKNSSLTLDSADFSAAGKYSVIVSNLGGSLKSKPINLIVILKPEILKITESMVVQLGAEAVLEVEASGTGPLEFEWFKSGVLIEGENSARLVFDETKLLDGGLYKVRVENEAGSVESAEMQLSVLEPVRIIKHPLGGDVLEGESFTFSVDAEGAAPLSYQWYKDEKSIESEINSKLILNDLDNSDSGIYHVEIFNQSSRIISNKVALSVELKSKPNSWTIMVYGHADHNLTSALMEDLLEMEQAGSGDGFNIVAQVDINTKDRRTKLWKLKQKVNPKDFDGVTRLLIGEDTDNKFKTFNSKIIEKHPEDLGMDDPKQLEDFINWSFREYPADRYGLVLWNHGAQFVGYGGDTQNGTLKHGKGLTSAQIREVLLNSLEDNDRSKFDFIGFDTCLMGAIEVLVDFRDLCDVYFGCAELDYGDGWDYNHTLNYIKSNPEADILELAENEVQHWDKHHQGQSMDDTHRVHAAFNMKKYDKFIGSFQLFAQLLNEQIRIDSTDIPRIRAESIHYSIPGRSNAKSPTHFIDLGYFSKNIADSSSGELKIAALDLVDKINEMVIAKAVGSERNSASGISIAYPHNINDWTKRYEKLYDEINFTNDVGSDWRLFLSEFGLMSQRDTVGPIVEVFGETSRAANLNRVEDEDKEYLSVTVADPAVLDLIVRGEDTYELSATLILPSGQDGLNYDYIGEVGVFRVEKEGEYQLNWPGTNPMIKGGGDDNEYWYDLGAWYTNRDSHQMISFANYQPPDSDELIEIFLFTEFDESGIGRIHTILEDSGQEIPDGEAVSATPASSSFELEPGGKLWPVYYAESYNEIINEWIYTEYYYEENFIKITDFGIDDIYLQYNQAIAGNYLLEIVVTDYFGNTSGYLDYNIVVPEDAEVVDSDNFIAQIEYKGQHLGDAPELNISSYVEYQKMANLEIDVEFLNWYYVEWPGGQGGSDYVLQSSNTVNDNWINISIDELDFDGVSYIYWVNAVSDNQFFRLIKND